MAEQTKPEQDVFLEFGGDARRMAAAMVKQRAEYDKLLAAIGRHRTDVWGVGRVGHPEDVVLYGAAGMEADHAE